MTSPQNPSELFSPFLPATFNIPEEDDRVKTFLNDKLSAISDVTNDKKIGCYTQETEAFNGEKWSYATTKKVRNGYQTIIYLPILQTTSIPNPIANIDSQFVVTHTWGSASKPPAAVGAGDGDYFSFNTEGNSKVTYTISDTTITVTSLGAFTGYSCFIVIEYLRDGRP